jgi:C4-dicarboxylate transporter, DcuC family
MNAILPWLGGIIVLATIWAIVKRWETRMVLFGSGLLMATVAMKPMEAFAAFQKSMTNAGLIAAILSVMGFAYVLKLTKCDEHLVNLVAGGVTKIRFALIPAATLATFVINIALTSAAGVTAAVGAVLIPVLMAAGVHPAVAAAAVFAGSFGSVLSPGASHIVMVAKMSGVAEIAAVAALQWPTIIAALIGTLTLTTIAYIRKEHAGYQHVAADGGARKEVNILKALVPMLPLVLLVLGAKVPALKSLNSVPAAMLIGSLVSIVVTRISPVDVTKAFFDGMGKAYGDVMGIIIAAGVFTAGLTQIGLIDLMLKNLKGVQGAIGAAATWGTIAVAVLSGSGDAATVAFNEAVTPHAAQFGMTVMDLGNLAHLAGTLGRTMSPVAGACIVAAGIAGVSPVEVAKRNAPGMIIASIVTFFLLGL